MSFWSGLSKLFGGGSKPKPKPPVVISPPPVRLVMVVDVLGPDGGPISGSVISGELQSGTSPIVPATPISFFKLRFELPKDVWFDSLVNLTVKASGYPDVVRVVKAAASLDVKVGKPAPTARPGVVRLIGKAWVDDGGPFYPLEFSLFSAPRFFAMGDVDYLDRNCDFVVRYGVNGVRIFYAWNRFPAERPDDLAGTIDRIYDRFGMRSFVTAQAAPRNKSGEQACREVLQVVQERRHKVLGLEGTNEQWASEAEAVHYAKILKAAGLPTAVGYGDAGVGKIVDLTKLAGVDVVSLHIERGGDEARQTRQCWDFNAIPYAGRNGEPGGPGSSVAEITAPDILAKLRAFGIICGAGDFVFHWGGGIFGDGVNGSGGQHRPRWISDVPNIDAQLRAVGNAHKCLPLGMENWQHFHGGNVLKLTKGACEKQYAARVETEMVQAITDAHGVLDFAAQDGNTWDWQLFDPSTGEPAVNGALDGYILKAQRR